MVQIDEVNATEILDCRLEPTIRVTVNAGDTTGTADVPCGRSRGKYEAVDLRDGGSRYNGLGVEQAISNIDQRIASAIIGQNVLNQRVIDRLLIEIDGTERKAELGGNAITGVSLAVAKCAANFQQLPLYKYIGGVQKKTCPIPFLDMIEGGELAATELGFQEHQVVPVGADSFKHAMQISAEVYYELGDYIAANFDDRSRNVGYEGGYTPCDMSDPRDAFEAELQVIEELGYQDEFALAADVAASHFYDERSGEYKIMNESYTRDQLITFYEDLVDTYPIISLEDPLDQDDFNGFKLLTDTLDIQIIGDDLFVTNTERLEEGITQGAANALLLKVNQVGTLTEALDAASIAFRNGYNVQVSERSGQTADTWLADLAVGINAGQIKTGVTRSERTEQYNRIFEIYQNNKSIYYGNKTLSDNMSM